MELFERTASELSSMLRNKECSSVEITESVYSRIEKVEDKVNSYIKGVKICGTTKDIEEMVGKYGVEDIIIAIPSASKARIDKIVTECQKTKCNIKILPSIYSSMNGGLARSGVVNKIRPLSYEDFLGRDQIVVNDQEISDSLENQVVLVTGGGGSIGSELCRQIAKYKPEKLIMLDIYENSLYDIEQELKSKYPKFC